MSGFIVCFPDAFELLGRFLILNEVETLKCMNLTNYEKAYVDKLSPDNKRSIQNRINVITSPEIPKVN